MKDYYSENLFKFLALLLQTVSFFTTYAGVELFFGDLFSLSTLFITLVIQIGLFVTSISVNRPGKKKFRGIFLMSILLIFSISFSYIGLITQVSSPKESYEEAYKKYQTIWNNTIDINPNVLSKDKIETSIKNELKKVTDTLKLLDQEILKNMNKKENLEDGEKPEKYYTRRSGNITINSDGTIIQEGDLREPNLEYNEYNKKLKRCENRISSLINDRLGLLNTICDITEKKLNNIKRTDIYSYYTNKNYNKVKKIFNNIHYSKIEQIFENASLDSLFDGKSGKNGISLTEEKCDRLIRQNNSTLKNQYIKNGSVNLYKIHKKLIVDKVEEYRKDSELEKVILKEWNDFSEEVLSVDNMNQKIFINKVLYIVGSWIGADLDNSSMHDLINLLDEMQNKVRDNYNIVSLYLDDPADTEILLELTKSKEEIEKIPNLLFIGFSRFVEAGKHRSNAIICIILAIFNDLMTVVLGWVGSRKAFSFLYVKSSKDYYNDIDELFGIVFKSMMQEFYISIRKGEFNTMNNSEFTEKCIKVVQKTSSAISSFLDMFTISECTTSMGYNLYFKYKTENDIKKYRPIISVLLKTNMLKIVPYVYYKYFELEYYCGTKLPVWEHDLGKDYRYDIPQFETYKELLDTNKDEGNVLLLRNRAENYLRENMYVDINVMEDESEP